MYCPSHRSPRRRYPRGLSFGCSKKILATRRTHDLSRKQITSLFDEALTNTEFTPTDIPQYAVKIKSGVRDFVKKTEKFKAIKHEFLISQKEYYDLKRKYVDNGPFIGIGGLFCAMLEGKKAVRLKTLRRQR